LAKGKVYNRYGTLLKKNRDVKWRVQRVPFSAVGRWQ
jgi:hypothetical protein